MQAHVLAQRWDLAVELGEKAPKLGWDTATACALVRAHHARGSGGLAARVLGAALPEAMYNYSEDIAREALPLVTETMVAALSPAAAVGVAHSAFVDAGEIFVGRYMPSMRDDTWAQLARAFAAAGKFAPARAAAGNIESPVDNQRTVGAVADSMIAAGLPQAAMEAIEDIGDSFYRAEAYDYVILPLLDHGDADHAAEAARRAAALARALRTPRKDQLMNHATDALVRTGQFEQAVVLARQCSDDYWRNLAFADIMKALVGADRIAAALDIGRDMAAREGESQAADALGKLARALVEAGRLDEAWQTVGLIRDQRTAAEAMPAIAALAHRQNRHDIIATLLARQRESNDVNGFNDYSAAMIGRAHVLCLAAVERYDEALEIADTIPGREGHFARRDVALKLATAGAHDRFLSIARTLEPGDLQLDALEKAIPVLLSDSGHPEVVARCFEDIAAIRYGGRYAQETLDRLARVVVAEQLESFDAMATTQRLSERFWRMMLPALHRAVGQPAAVQPQWLRRWLCYHPFSRECAWEGVRRLLVAAALRGLPNYLVAAARTCPQLGLAVLASTQRS